MQTQTKILNESNLLQQRLTLPQLIPYFNGVVFYKPNVDGNFLDSYNITLINTGIAAANLTITNFSPKTVELTPNEGILIPTNQRYAIGVKPVDKKQGLKQIECKFLLHFFDDSGNEFQQFIALKDATIRVIPPTLVGKSDKSFSEDDHEIASIL